MNKRQTSKCGVPHEHRSHSLDEKQLLTDDAPKKSHRLPPSTHQVALSCLHPVCLSHAHQLPFACGQHRFLCVRLTHYSGLDTNLASSCLLWEHRGSCPVPCCLTLSVMKISGNAAVLKSDP